MRYLQNGADRELVRDLPVIERVDLYSEIDDLAFLESLMAEGILHAKLTMRSKPVNFPDRTAGWREDRRRIVFRARRTAAAPRRASRIRRSGMRRFAIFVATWGTMLGLPPTHGLAQSDLEVRRQRIESLSPSEKRELIAKKDRFDRLPDAEQERLRQLDEQIRNDPRAAELEQVLERYGQWLATLSSKDRAALQEMAPQDRLVRIQQLRQSEAGSPSLQDVDSRAQTPTRSINGGTSFAEQNEPLLVKFLADKEREAYEQMPRDDPRRSFMLRFSVWRSLGKLLEDVPRDDTNRLIEQLQKRHANSF